MQHDGNSQLRKVIELDEVSGRFELDADGYTRFYPSPEEKKSLETWLSLEIERAERENRARFDAQAENRETYSAVKVTLPNDTEAILPSPIARIPVDQIIASTHNNILRPKPIFSFDPYFDSQYPVLMPSPEYDPTDPDMAPFAGVPTNTPATLNVDAETVSRHLEAGIDFVFRERLDFAEVNHKLVDAAVIEGYGWIKTCRKKKTRNVIQPRVVGSLVYLDDEEEAEYADGSEIYIEFIHDSNMLRPNMTMAIDDLPWLCERIAPPSPDEIRASYANDEYFLYDEPTASRALRSDEVERLARTVGVTVDESKSRTDTTTRKITPEEPERNCDVREAWAHRWLYVASSETGEKERRKFSLLLTFHYGARKLMAAMRNPYNHQRRIHRVASQFLDGSSTASVVKYNQQIGTHLIQAEIKNAYQANNYARCFDPYNEEMAKFAAANPVLTSGIWIPGMQGKAWDVVRVGADHASLLPVIQWNAGTAQETSKVSDYEAGVAPPSHTSPNVVNMLLDRGGQQSVLFLGMLDRLWRDVVRLWLETARQYRPLGEIIPQRNAKGRAITMVPFRYPIGEALDNFHISLTAANEAMSRERDPDQITQRMDTYQRHATFMMQPIGALLNPATTPDQAKMYLKIIEGGQTLLDQLISVTRVDEETFNIVPAVMSVIAEKEQLIAQAKAQQEMQANATATNQPPVAGGSVPAPPEGDMAGSTGLGGEPAMAGDPANSANAGAAPPVPPGPG